MLERDLAERIGRTAAAVLAVCGASAAEAILLLTDDRSQRAIVDRFLDAARELGPGGDPLLLRVAAREPAFADLPPRAVDALLAADLVVDLTTVPWLYSDSWTRYVRECGPAGSRIALVWASDDGVRTLAACPPSPRLAARARQGLAKLNAGRRLHLRSDRGTDFSVDLGDPAQLPRAFIGEPPVAPGAIGAPLCASVTAPFVPGTASGAIAFVGAGRVQGPVNRPLRSSTPVLLSVRDGRVAGVAGEGPAAVELADWFAAAPTSDVFRLMDCNLGVDPRAELDWADNTVVHAFAGGIMIGIGDPYQYRPEGSHRPGYHLDLMLPGLDADLDGVPLLREGRFTPESGIAG